MPRNKLRIHGERAHRIAVKEFRRIPLHERGGIVGEAAIWAWEEAKARALYETTKELEIHWEPEVERYEDVYGFTPEQAEYYCVSIRRKSDGKVLTSLGFVDSDAGTTYGRMVENELLLEALS